MRDTNVWIRAAGLTVAVALTVGGAAACGGSGATGKEAPAPAGGSSATTAATTTAATAAATSAATSSATTAAPSATASPALPDGRSAVYLTGLDTVGKTVTFDLIEFLTGDAAKAQWKKEHPDNPDGPDNDYMIVNKNKKLRTMPVAAGAKCAVLATLGGTDTKTISFADLPAFLKKHNKGITVTPPNITVLPFWLTVHNGAVTHFEEQFLP